MNITFGALKKTALAAMAAGIAMVSSVANADTQSLEQDLATIMEWWDGDYNNDKQLAALRAEGKKIWTADGSGEGGFIAVVSHYRPIEMPQLGEHVIYVEETKHGDPDNIFRQRLYTLSVDEENQVVRVKLWSFKDKEKYKGAWKDLSMLADVQPDDLTFLPDNCDLLGVRDGDKYHLPMGERACAFGDRYFSYQVMIGPDSFWFRDKIVNLETDEVLQSAGDYDYHRLDKIVK